VARRQPSGPRDAGVDEPGSIRGDGAVAWERSHGSRSLTLPEGADADHAEADLRNGVLTLSVPKLPQHQPRKISLRGSVEKVKGVPGAKEKGTA
jgi:hypothetical protein